jgi:hypothetical protein
MWTNVAEVEAALARAGWRAGAEALVAGWVEYRQSELEWEETWKPDDRRRYISERPGGERFVIEAVSGDEWKFYISWPNGWGSEFVRTGFLEDLQEDAWERARSDGPFGGPQGPAGRVCALPGERGRRLSGDVEVRLEMLREDLAAYFHITRRGILNHLHIAYLDSARLSKTLAAFEKLSGCGLELRAWAHGKQRTWSFTTWRPLLAHMRLGERELLLSCPDESTAVILAHTAGHIQAAAEIDMRALPDLDTKWFAEDRSWPDRRRTFGSAGSASSGSTTGVPPSAGSTGSDPAHPGSPPRPSSPVAPSSATPTAGAVPSPQPTASASSEPRGAEPVEPSVPAGVPAPTMPEPPSPAPHDVNPPEPEPAKPRFTCAVDASPEEIERHFSEVEAAIPPKLTGTAVAVELWQAIREAHHQGALPITGNWVDLVSALHHRGWLPHLPSDRSSRAALVILASLSPLVRRLHHRRWALGQER